MPYIKTSKIYYNVPSWIRIIRQANLIQFSPLVALVDWQTRRNDIDRVLLDF